MNEVLDDRGGLPRVAARGDTRERIQQVALELFAEQGYDKTSLREIAERLGVTKAALYYHFQSKDDIVASLVADHFGRIDQLIAWGAGQAPGPGLRREIISRYVTIVAEGDAVFRMLQQNQASVQTLAAAKSRHEVFRERLGALIDLLAGPGAELPGRLRAAMALGGVSVGLMFLASETSDREQLGELVRGIAGEFLDHQSP